jgi:two-component system cell cycle sensor histidine kinase PleC
MSADQDVFPRAVSLAVHELRTPVTVVAGYLRMLLREQGGPLTEKQRKMLDEAERSCGRLAALVAEMSELGKLQGGSLPLAKQDVNVAALLAELASGMHEGEDRGVRLELRGIDEPMVVTGDQPRLAAAIKALLHAALRERGEPGVIVAQCSTAAVPDSRYAVIAIGDESVLPELVAGARDTPPPFDEWRGGTGLALPVARRVIEGHGGALWSAAGERSRAASALRLPLRT